MQSEHNINHIQTAVEKLGGPTSAAKQLGVKSYQSVQQWVVAGQVPAQYCKRVESLTGVTCDKLRPVDYLMIWPELAN